VATASPPASSGSDQRTAGSGSATMRVRSTVGHRVNCVPITASPTQPSRFRCTWARRMARQASAEPAAPPASSTPRPIPASSAALAAT
jgi:hypothetical protein